MLLLLLTSCWKFGIDLKSPVSPQECEPILWYGEQYEKLKQRDCLYANHGFSHAMKGSLQLVSGEVHYQFPEDKTEEFEEDFLALQKWGETESELPMMELQGYFRGEVLHDEHDGLHAMLHAHEKEAEKEDELKIQFNFLEQDGLFICEPSELFDAGLRGAAGQFLDPIINGMIGYNEYGYMDSEKHPEARTPLDHKQASYNSKCLYTTWNGVIYPRELFLSKQMSRNDARTLLSSLRENTNVIIAGEEQELLQLPEKVEGWPNFGQYQYSSVLNFGEKETKTCERRQVVKWAKTEAINYGILDPKRAVNYRSWACQMGIQQIQTIGFYSKGALYLHRRYHMPF